MAEGSSEAQALSTKEVPGNKQQFSVKVTNVAATATVPEIFHHFEYAGTICNINLQPGDSGAPAAAYVTFTDKKALDTALLLSESSIKGSIVSVQAAEPDYVPPPNSQFYSVPAPPPEPAGAVKVSGLAQSTTLRQIQDFFSYAGTISSIEWKADAGEAFVGFYEKKSIETALLLSDAKLNDNIVTIVEGPSDYKPSAEAKLFPLHPEKPTSPALVALKQAEAAMRKIFESTVALGAGALSATATKAKELDEKHQFTRTASTKASELKTSAAAAVSDIQKRFTGAPEVLSKSVVAGTEQVNQSISSVDKQYNLTEKAQGVFAAAEQRLNEVGSYLLQSKVISQGRDMLVGTAAKVSEVVEGGPSAPADEAAASKAEVSMTAMEGQGSGAGDVKPEEKEAISESKVPAPEDTKTEAAPEAEKVEEVPKPPEATKVEEVPKSGTAQPATAAPAPPQKSTDEDVPVF